MKHETLTVYYIEILDGKGACLCDTKICFSSVLRAIGRGRQMKKEYHGEGCRVENADTGKVYWI